MGRIDLDNTQEAASEVDPVADATALEQVVRDWADRQAVANILFQPCLLPRDVQLPALMRGLNGPNTYLQLASASGAAALGGADGMGEAAHQ